MLTPARAHAAAPDAAVCMRNDPARNYSQPQCKDSCLRWCRIASQVADAATLQELHKEDCTLQLHQPQRFFDPCWRLLAALERQLGCLVGTNA